MGLRVSYVNSGNEMKLPNQKGNNNYYGSYFPHLWLTCIVRVCRVISPPCPCPFLIALLPSLLSAS